MKLFLQEFIDIHSTLDFNDKNGNNPVHLAVLYDEPYLLKKIINKCYNNNEEHLITEFNNKKQKPIDLAYDKCLDILSKYDDKPIKKNIDKPKTTFRKIYKNRKL